VSRERSRIATITSGEPSSGHARKSMNSARSRIWLKLRRFSPSWSTQYVPL
jgi:hypothetical protein